MKLRWTPASLIAMIIIIALGSGVYLYFVPSVHLSPLKYHLVDYVNNYPQPEKPATEGGEKIFLGDRFLIAVEIKNKSLRPFKKLALKLSFSQQMRINAINDIKNAGYQNVEDHVFEIDRLLPFETRTEFLVLTSSVSGGLKIEAELTHPTANKHIENGKQLLQLLILPRPIDSTPRVPADITSYLGDLIRENCNVVPQACPNVGKCISVPYTSEIQKCLIEEGERIYSGCGEPPLDESTVDEWQVCLMKKYGFMK